ncbi:MAG: hypothetical protein OJF48_003579 [Afipia sp.]|nr:MAG: hypothetical protein OJF48_003579 [Afipia sp.]
MAKRTTSLPQRNIENWATDILIHAHAIVPCPDCGFKRLRFAPQAVDYAHALAAHERFSGLTKVQRIEAVDAVLDGLGDDCPALQLKEISY